MSIDNFYLSAAEYTPEISLQKDGNLSIKGKSYPENCFKFYQPVVDWLKVYLVQENNPKRLVFSFHLVYFNSSTAKQIFDLLTILSEQYNKYEVIIRWFYDEENDNAIEEGNCLISDFPTLTFEMIEV